MNEREPIVADSNPEKEVSGRFAEKQEKLLEKIRHSARPAMLAVVLGITALGFPGASEAFSPKPLPEKTNEEIRRGIEETRRKIYVIDSLNADIGISGTARIFGYESIQNPEERKDRLKERKEIPINNFEGFKISSGDIETLFEEDLPKAFSKNIHSLSYRDEVVELPDVYGKKGVQKRYSAAHIDREGRIEVSKKGGEQSPKAILETLLHECGHAADWKHNSLLTREERLELCKQIIDRVRAPDRFVSSYVESIQNDDPKVELELKAGEYWAEIVSAYCSELAVLLSPEDIRIINSVFEKTDPGFNITRLRTQVRSLAERNEEKKPEEPEFVAEPIPHRKRSKTQIRFSEELLREIQNDEGQPLEGPEDGSPRPKSRNAEGLIKLLEESEE